MVDRWYFADEIAEYLGIGKDTAYNWVTNMNMPRHKAGRLWKFKTSEVDEWICASGGDSGKDAETKS